MFAINIDISGVANTYNFTSEDGKALSNYVLDRITDVYMSNWEQLVDKNLHKTADMYKAGMDAQRPDDYTAIFSLEKKEDSAIALMIEDGASSFDEKQGFERSEKKKTSKSGGWFLTIPFRIASAESIASSNIFSGKMSKAVLKTIQDLPKGESLTASNMPPELQIKGIRAEIPGYKPAYEHKSFDFEGLRHSTKPGHGQYEMFRRVSDESDPNSWIHKGLQPHNFMEKALQETDINSIYDECVSEFLEKWQ
jgi:hypothetical protein